jgi:hypothetical protein
MGPNPMIAPFWDDLEIGNGDVFYYYDSGNNYFVVERSPDGLDFVELGKVTGAGNSNTAKSYYFTDNNPATGLNYYRIKQVDYNGHFEYSKIIVVENQNEEISIYPNPVTNVLNITGIVNQNTRFSISDVSGRKIKEDFMVINGKIDVSKLPSGIYYLTITSSNKTTVKKFVKR